MQIKENYHHSNYSSNQQEQSKIKDIKMNKKRSKSKKLSLLQSYVKSIPQKTFQIIQNYLKTHPKPIYQANPNIRKQSSSPLWYDIYIIYKYHQQYINSSNKKQTKQKIASAVNKKTQNLFLKMNQIAKNISYQELEQIILKNDNIKFYYGKKKQFKKEPNIRLNNNSQFQQLLQMIHNSFNKKVEQQRDKSKQNQKSQKKRENNFFKVNNNDNKCIQKSKCHKNFASDSQIFGRLSQNEFIAQKFKNFPQRYLCYLWLKVEDLNLKKYLKKQSDKIGNLIKRKGLKSILMRIKYLKIVNFSWSLLVSQFFKIFENEQSKQ